MPRKKKPQKQKKKQTIETISVLMRKFSCNYDDLVSGCHHGMLTDKDAFKKFFRKFLHEARMNND